MSITTVDTNLEEHPIDPEAWSVIVTIFLHLPPFLRREVHAAATAGLHSGGVFILEAYAPGQVK